MSTNVSATFDRVKNPNVWDAEGPIVVDAILDVPQRIIFGKHLDHK
ncbi:MAG TPA: hypothetical protein VHZ07_04930 [Bryobacteraceae bacterium]|nr:hypothetical protein [Bryobacteraceae bacterium]